MKESILLRGNLCHSIMKETCANRSCQCGLDRAETAFTLHPFVLMKFSLEINIKICLMIILFI